MIETFKITHNFYDPQTTKHFFIIPTDSVTRGHPFKITKKACKSRQYAHFFTNRIVNQWNSLPEQVVRAETINSFKNRLHKHWSKFQYKTNFNIQVVCRRGRENLKLRYTVLKKQAKD